jgi:hypothetical protein
VLGDANAGDRCGEVPVLFGSDSDKVGEGNIRLPGGGTAAETIGIRVRGEVGSTLGRPEGWGGFGDASAVLGVVDASAAGTAPEGDARSITNYLRDIRPYRAEVKGLAVSAVAEIEVVYFVAMEICQCKSACSDSEGFEWGRGFVRGGFGGEDSGNISFWRKLKSDAETVGGRGDFVEARSFDWRDIFFGLDPKAATEVDAVIDVP